VQRPAATVAVGPRGAAVAPSGSVAGVGDHEILLRLPSKSATVRSLRILAADQQPSNATILTNLAAGDSLFRFLAPTPGSKLVLERDGKTGPIPPNYGPRKGDGLIIIVSEPPPPFAVSLENKPCGHVVLEGQAGDRTIIGQVKQPLRGIGRYANCQRAGAGSLVSYSPTLITVSTVSELRRLDENGKEIESRGGFIIQPSEPGLRGTTHPASQILVARAGPRSAQAPVSTLFGLPLPISTRLPTDRHSTRVEVKIDGGDWEPMPDLPGTVNEADLLPALAKALSRPVHQGITHLRLTPGRLTTAAVRQAIRLAMTPPSELGPQRGTVDVTADVKGEGIVLVSFYLDGQLVAITNARPYSWRFKTTAQRNGEHLIEIRGQDADGAIVNSVFTRLRVDN